MSEGILSHISSLVENDGIGGNSTTGVSNGN